MLVKILLNEVSIRPSLKKYLFAVTRPTHQNRPDSTFFFDLPVVKIFFPTSAPSCTKGRNYRRSSFFHLVFLSVHYVIHCVRLTSVFIASLSSMRIPFVLFVGGANMADGCGKTVAFSVTVIEHRDKEGPIYHAKNAIRKFNLIDTWFDVFSIVTENADIDDETDKHFEKIAKVEVSASPTSSTFNPDPYDKISVLHDFDSNLKYVVINLKFDNQTKGPASAVSQSVNAFDLLMGASTRTRKPAKIPDDKLRFTGMINRIFVIYSKSRKTNS